MISTYSPGELSYLLAGRTTAPADFARKSLGLEQLDEDDVGVLTGAQNLVANGKAAVEAGLVQIGEEAKVVGYLLGTATDWIKVSIQTEHADEGVTSIAMAFASSEPDGPALVMRILPLSNIEIAVLGPEASTAVAAEALVRGYLERYEIVTVAVQREAGDFAGEVGAARTADTPLRVIRRIRVEGLDDVRHPQWEEASNADFLTQLATLLAGRV
jgi:hypothetical protein